MASQPFYGISGHVTVTVAPENIPKFLELLRAAFEKVAAEPECTFFELYQSADEPGVFSWVEAWSKDMKWLLEVQLQKDYYKPFNEALEPMLIKPREVKVFERLAPGWATAKPEHFKKD